jgi:predicted nucleotidyltransferase
MLKERFQELETLLCEETKSFYGSKLVSLVVYGSAGRGTQRHDSDIDILVVADGLPQGRMNRNREFEAVEKKLEPALLSLQGEGIRTRISPVIKTAAEAAGGSPLFLDMVEDARILVDRNGFFARVLDLLRSKLESLGAKRVWKGSAWYWDLKPDYRPGDVIEL